GAVQVGAEVPAELVHERLGRPVDVAAGVGVVGGGGADVDDVAAVPLDHAGQQGAGAVHEPGAVGVEHALPLVGVGLLGRAQAQGPAGVVHQDVHLGEGGGERGPRLPHGGAVAHVQPDRVDGLLAQFLAESVQALGAAGGRHDAGPVG